MSALLSSSGAKEKIHVLHLADEEYFHIVFTYSVTPSLSSPGTVVSAF